MSSVSLAPDSDKTEGLEYLMLLRYWRIWWPWANLYPDMAAILGVICPFLSAAGPTIPYHTPQWPTSLLLCCCGSPYLMSYHAKSSYHAKPPEESNQTQWLAPKCISVMLPNGLLSNYWFPLLTSGKISFHEHILAVSLMRCYLRTAWFKESYLMSLRLFLQDRCEDKIVLFFMIL